MITRDGKSASKADFDTLAELNANFTDGTTLDTSTSTRPPASHTQAASTISDSTTAGRALLTAANAADQLTALGTDAAGAERPAASHSLGGSRHSSATLAQLNAKLSDATLDTSTASRPPSAHAITAHTGAGDIVTHAVSEFATAAQGTRANAAAIPGDITDGHLLGRSGAAWASVDPATLGGIGIKNRLGTTPPTAGAAFEAVYQFDGTASNLLDRTANGHDLALAAGTAMFGRAGSAALMGIVMRGAHRYDAAASAALRITGALTVECCCAFDDLGGYDVIANVGVGGAGDEISWWVGVNNSEQRLTGRHQAAGGADQWALFASSPPMGRLTYLAFTRAADGRTWTCYQDGAICGSAVVTASAAATGADEWLSVGNNPGGTTIGFQGTLVDLRISAQELSAAQVAEVYAGLIA